MAIDCPVQLISYTGALLSIVSGAVGGCCVKKTRKRHAVREMKEGPSEPPYRRRLQTAISGCGQKPRS